MKSGEIWVFVSGVWVTRTANVAPPPQTGGFGKMPFGTGPFGKGS